MELNIAVSRRGAKRKREEKLFRDALKHERRIVRKPEPTVERRIADENAAICPELAKFRKALPHQGSPNTTALQIRLYRNRAEPIPANRLVIHRNRRDRNMSNDAAGLFGNERN